MRRYLLVIILMCLLNHALAQSSPTSLTQKNGLPTNRIYDLFIDSKGFLWIAHELGLTRYDGTNFTNYTSEDRARIHDITEDKLGRIWCLALNRNVYMLVDNKLKVIKSYDGNIDGSPESIKSYNNKIYITTARGLTSYDVFSMKSESIVLDNRFPDIITYFNNIIIHNNKVFIYDGFNRKIFVADESHRFKSVIASGPKKAFRNNILWRFFQKNVNAPVYMVYSSFNDKKNWSRICSVTFSGNDVKITPLKYYYDGQINSITVGNQSELWINAEKTSFSTKGTRYDNYNLDNLVIDKQGNKWFSSFQNGLFVAYKQQPLEELHLAKEKIVSIAKQNQYLLFGTKPGMIYKYDASKKAIIRTFRTPGINSPVGHIGYIGGRNFIISKNSEAYLFNDSMGTFRDLGKRGDVSDVVKYDTYFFISGTYFSASYNLTDLQQWDKYLFPQILHMSGYPLPPHSLAPADAASFNDSTKALLIARAGSLTEFNHGAANDIYFNQSQITATALCYANNKLFIASSGDGLLVYENYKVRLLIPKERLNPSYITKIKEINKKLWLFGSGAVQIVDIATGNLVKNDLTGDVEAHDAEAIRGEIYIISLAGLYKDNICQSSYPSESFECFNLFTSLNGHDTLYGDHVRLPYNKNNIRFNLTSPIYNSPEKTYYIYRLIGRGDKKWQYSKPGETTIYFNTLEPGNYIFQASAYHPYFGQSSNTISYNFIILEPWWQTWWFKTATFVLITLIIFFLIRPYYVYKLYKQRLQFEKALAIEVERQNISREIHDHIGQSLSVVKLNLNMGSSPMIEEAKTILSDVIEDLREFTHKLYNGKTLMNSLIVMIKKDVERLNTYGQIRVSTSLNWSENVLIPTNELLIYRIFQEATNNILRHADAKNVTITTNCSRKEFILTIRDDGKGFTQATVVKGLGLYNMYKRAELAGGRLKIISQPGQGTEIKLVIDLSVKN